MSQAAVYENIQEFCAALRVFLAQGVEKSFDAQFSRTLRDEATGIETRDLLNDTIQYIKAKTGYYFKVRNYWGDRGNYSCSQDSESARTTTCSTAACNGKLTMLPETVPGGKVVMITVHLDHDCGHPPSEMADGQERKPCSPSSHASQKMNVQRRCKGPCQAYNISQDSRSDRCPACSPQPSSTTSSPAKVKPSSKPKSSTSTIQIRLKGNAPVPGWVCGKCKAPGPRSEGNTTLCCDPCREARNRSQAFSRKKTRSIAMIPPSYRGKKVEDDREDSRQIIRGKSGRELVVYCEDEKSEGSTTDLGEGEDEVGMEDRETHTLPFKRAMPPSRRKPKRLDEADDASTKAPLSRKRKSDGDAIHMPLAKKRKTSLAGSVLNGVVNVCDDVVLGCVIG